jgi:hypothetical protein
MPSDYRRPAVADLMHATCMSALQPPRLDLRATSLGSDGLNLDLPHLMAGTLMSGILTPAAAMRATIQLTQLLSWHWQGSCIRVARPRQITQGNIRLNGQSEARNDYAERTRLAWWRYVISATLLGCLIILAAVSFALAWVDGPTTVGSLSLQAALFFSLLAVYAASATRRRWRLLQKALLSARLRERRQFRKSENYEV